MLTRDSVKQVKKPSAVLLSGVSTDPIHHRAKSRHVHGPVKIVGGIFFAQPDQMHRPAGRHRRPDPVRERCGSKPQPTIRAPAAPVALSRQALLFMRASCSQDGRGRCLPPA